MNTNEKVAVTLNLDEINMPVKLKPVTHHVSLGQMIYTQKHMRWYHDEARKKQTRKIKRLPRDTLTLGENYFTLESYGPRTG
jgi:hypothetical protein